MVSLFIIISVIGIDISFEKIYYKNNSNWTDYKDWEAARYKIQANAPEKAVLENPAKYGWTKAEAEIFKDYNAINPTYFTESKLNQLISDSQNTTKINFEFLICDAMLMLFAGGTIWSSAPVRSNTGMLIRDQSMFIVESTAVCLRMVRGFSVCTLAKICWNSVWF